MRKALVFFLTTLSLSCALFRTKPVPYPTGVVFPLVVAAGVAGCGPANPRDRLPVSGTVTLDGAPLDQGSIQFRPYEREDGVGSGAMIKNGKYEIPVLKGLPVGKYRVRINSARADESALPPESGGFMAGRPTVERIPAKYNRNSEEIIEVTAGGPNEFNYEIVTE